jgi:hypothetical protein
MSKTSVAEQAVVTPEAEGPRKAPDIDPSGVKVDVDGLVTRSVVVRLPAGMIANDLGLPSIWRRVQNTPVKALRKLDRLLLISWDESVAYSCIVAEAGPSSVSLSVPVKHELKTREQPYFADDKYRVAWSGVRFQVVRISDNHVVSDHHTNEALAIQALRAMYPKAVA